MDRKNDEPKAGLLPIRPPARPPPPKRVLPERNGPGISKELALAKVGSISASFSTAERVDAEAAHLQGTFFRELWVNRAELLWTEEKPEKDTLKNFLAWASQASGVPPTTIRDHMDFAAIATAEQALLGISRCKAGHVIAHYLGLEFQQLFDDRKVQAIIGRPLHFRIAKVSELEELCVLLAKPPQLPAAEEPSRAKVKRYKAAIARTLETHAALAELKPRVKSYGGEVTVKHLDGRTRAHFEALAALYQNLLR